MLDYYSVFLFVALFLLFSLAQNKNLLVPQLINFLISQAQLLN